MKCAEFNKMLIDYFDNNLDTDKKAKMDDHLRTCSQCSNLLKNSKLLLKDSTQNPVNIEFESRLNNIMDYANTHKYENSVKDKLYFHLKKHIYSYAVSIISIFIIFTAKPYIQRSSENLYAILNQKEIDTKIDTNIDTSENTIFFDQFPKPIDETSQLYNEIISSISRLSSKVDSKITDSSKIYTIIKKESDYKYIISKGNDALNIVLYKLETEPNSEIVEKIYALAAKELLGQNMDSLNITSGKEWYSSYFNTLNPMPELTFKNNGNLISPKVSSAKKAVLESLLKEINNTRNTEDIKYRFSIKYSSADKIVFRNFNYIIVYDITEEAKGISNIIKAKSLDNKITNGKYNYLNCETISPDGNYGMITVFQNNGNYYKQDSLSFIYDFRTDSHFFIGKGSELFSFSKWSPSSNYFITPAESGEKITVCNVENKTVKTITPKQYSTPLLISDEGNFILSAYDNFIATNHYFLGLKDDYNSIKEINISGTLLKFDSEGIQYWDNNGNIKNYILSSSESVLLKNIGSDFKLLSVTDDCLTNKSAAIFKSVDTFKSYDINTKSVNTLSDRLFNSFGIYTTYSPKLTRAILENSLHLSIKNSTGIIKTTSLDNRYTSLRWKDDNTLIGIVSEINPSSMGDFKIVKIDANTGTTIVLFEP